MTKIDAVQVNLIYLREFGITFNPKWLIELIFLLQI